jgi:hypothetical protein
MPNGLLKISKVSFREEFSSQIYNSYDARSKQSGLLMIYRIYLKSFMIFSDLYMCCFAFTKLLGTHTSNNYRLAAVPACPPACAHGHAAWWRCAPRLRGGSRMDTVGSVPARGKQSPLLYCSLSLYFLILFSSTHVPPLQFLAVDHKRCRPDDQWQATGEFLLLLSMIPFLSLRFQFNQAVFHRFSPTPVKQNQVWPPPLLSSLNFRVPKRNVGEPLVTSHQFPGRFRRRARRILTSITGHGARVPICDWDSRLGTQL